MADDVGLDGRANDAERDRFGNGDDEQRAFGVGDRGDRRNVLDDAEEVGALHKDAGGFIGHRGVERGNVDAAGFAAVANERGGNLLMRGIGGQHFAVLGMNGAGDGGAVAASDADGHHHGLGRSCGTVVHAGVGHVHAGQLGDHGLEFEDRL